MLFAYLIKLVSVSGADTDPYHTSSAFFRFDICAYLQMKNKAFVIVDIFKCSLKLQMLLNMLVQLTFKTVENFSSVAACFLNKILI